jgi:transcriptional regulator with XRE-family HTH domain
MALNDVIKKARLKQNLKQDDAAKLVGVTVQTYSKWENGKTEPKASQVSKLAKILKLSEKEICQGNLNQRVSLEEFLEETGACRKNNPPSVPEEVMMWRYLDDHASYFKALEKVYKNESNPHLKLIEKAD